MTRPTITVLAVAAALALPAAANAGSSIEERLGAATRATVVCSPDPGAAFHIVASRPVVSLWDQYCAGIRRDIDRRFFEGAAIQGWALVGRQTAIVRCWLRTGDANVCDVFGQTLAYADADEFVPGAMRRAGATGGTYSRRMTAHVAAFIEATT